MRLAKVICCTVAAGCLLSPACSVKKRVHRPGYYVSWHASKPRAGHQSAPIQSNRQKERTVPRVDVAVAQASEQHVLSASSEATPVLIKAPRAPGFEVSSEPIESARFETSPATSTSEKAAGTPAEDDAEYSGFAILGFIMSAVGLLLCLVVGFPFLLGTAGAIVSAVGLKHTSRGLKGESLAIAGIVMGVAAIILYWLIYLGILAVL